MTFLLVVVVVSGLVGSGLTLVGVALLITAPTPEHALGFLRAGVLYFIAAAILMARMPL